MKEVPIDKELTAEMFDLYVHDDEETPFEDLFIGDTFTIIEPRVPLDMNDMSTSITTNDTLYIKTSVNEAESLTFRIGSDRSKNIISPEEKTKFFMSLGNQDIETQNHVMGFFNVFIPIVLQDKHSEDFKNSLSEIKGEIK